ncbi:hypothetical protein DM785_02400 [Deinococcus actinosclerus]|nr:hypothetical protein DM785_02400 [Deinococcus actinosclerus]
MNRCPSKSASVTADYLLDAPSATVYARYIMAPLPPKVSFPARRNDPRSRGIALTFILQERKITQSQFALDSGIQRQILNRYMTGAYDLANMSQELVERLLTALGMSDIEARTYFGIPEEAWVRWKTFRPPPLGHGAGELGSASERVVGLKGGVQGVLTVAADVADLVGAVVDTQVTTGMVLTRWQGGLWALRAAPGEQVPGEVLGGLLRLAIAR